LIEGLAKAIFSGCEEAQNQKNDKDHFDHVGLPKIYYPEIDPYILRAKIKPNSKLLKIVIY
jgi:hypothetical protein